MTDKLAIIITGVNEWPQVIYTIRSIYEEFRDRANFELIYVDNFPNILDQWNSNREPDQSWKVINESAKNLPNFRVMEYRDHLSHWVCKSKAVESSNANFFLFVDAHVIPGRDCLFNQYEYYRKNHEELNGSIHVPLTYKILEGHLLQYKMINELDKGWIGYTFTTHNQRDGKPYKVPCHSTCGSLISRRVYEQFGGWPELMQAWGGGENLFNYTLSVLGMNKWLLPGKPLYHDGAPRGYSYNNDGLILNRTIAMYMVGGYELAELYIKNQEGNKQILNAMLDKIISNNQIVEQRKLIELNQITNINAWANQWKQ